MYTEEYEHKGFPFKDFLIKLILVIVFVLLLVWLLPKFITPTTIVKNNNKAGNTEDGSSVVSNESTSKTFQENIDKMKEAAISYYTDERLPQNVGESKKMTLKQMINEKLITELYDKNKKLVDSEKSYVKITKTDDEYILKVSIKDSEKEDYVLVHLGCYSYCTTTICEKDNSSTGIAKGAKSSTYNPVVSVKPSTGSNSNSRTNTKDTHKSSSSSSSKTTKSTNKSSTSSSTSTGKSTSSSASSSSSSSSSSNSSSSSGSSNGGSKIAYEYEYKKSTGTQLSKWSNWSDWSKTSCDTKEVNCSDSDITCLKKIQLYNRKEKIGTYTKKYTKSREVTKQVGSYEVKACSNYNYVIVDNTTYATTTTTTYTTINNVTYKTKTSICSSSVCSWTYVGRYTYSNPPRDTADTHYVFAGADFSYCAETCQSIPKYYYDKYVFNGSTSSSSTTVKVVTPGETTSSSTTKVTSNSTITVTANCGSYVTKTVPIYATITVSDIATREEPLYGTVCYKSTKTRTITQQGSTQTKWSYYNDTSLLNSGWSYTGNKRAA